MPPGNIFDVAARHRAELLRGDKQAASAMIEAYGEAWRKIEEQLGRVWETLEGQKQLAQAEGREFRPNDLLLYQRDRLQALQRQVEAEIAQIADLADGVTLAAQAEAVAAARRDSAELIEASLRQGVGEPGTITGSFARVPVEALQDLVGFAQDGSPLKDLFEDMPGQAGQAVYRALVRGLATGQNPRTIARAIRKELGYSLARFLTIARTEVLRSYREAARRNYLANDDVVRGWVWLSARQSRTCAACWALSGTFHKLGERLEDHPNGRCTMLPVTKSRAELGLGPGGETSIAGRVPQGADLFERLPESDKLRILGGPAYRAYRAGAVKLPDFVGHKRNRRWGGMHYTRSLREILGKQEAKKYYAPRGPAGQASRAPAISVAPPSMPAATAVAPLTPEEATAAREEALRAWEETVFALKYERALLADPEGKQLIEKKGAASSVSFEDDELKLFPGNHLSHNHPVSGGAFSPEDIAMCLRHRLAEVRAVGTQDGTRLLHVVRPSKDAYDHRTEILQLFVDTDRELRRELWGKISAGELTPEQASAQHYHIVWTRVDEQAGAAGYALNYHREDWKREYEG